MINFACKKCIHFSCCMFKTDAAREIEVFNNRIQENEPFNIKLSCNHFTNIDTGIFKRK